MFVGYKMHTRTSTKSLDRYRLSVQTPSSTSLCAAHSESLAILRPVSLPAAVPRASPSPPISNPLPQQQHERYQRKHDNRPMSSPTRQDPHSYFPPFPNPFPVTTAPRRSQPRAPDRPPSALSQPFPSTKICDRVLHTTSQTDGW